MSCSLSSSLLFGGDITHNDIKGHPPGKKLVGGNGRPTAALLMKSKTVLGSSHELNANQTKNNDDDNVMPSGVQQRLSPAPPSSPIRSKVKTNGHLIPYMQQVGLPFLGCNQIYDISYSTVFLSRPFNRSFQCLGASIIVSLFFRPN